MLRSVEGCAEPASLSAPRSRPAAGGWEGAVQRLTTGRDADPADLAEQGHQGREGGCRRTRRRSPCGCASAARRPPPLVPRVLAPPKRRSLPSTRRAGVPSRQRDGCPLRAMAATGKSAWFALMNRKTPTAGLRSPARTRPSRERGYRAPTSTAGSRAAAGRVRRARSPSGWDRRSDTRRRCSRTHRPQADHHSTKAGQHDPQHCVQNTANALASH